MARIHNYPLSGITYKALSEDDTTLHSPSLKDFPTVTGGDYATITLEPDSSDHKEIVHVTTHVSGGTTAEIMRGQEGTSAVEHARFTSWRHQPEDADYNECIDSPELVTEVLVVDEAADSHTVVPSDYGKEIRMGSAN